MIRVSLRGVAEHLVRFALSVLAVALGVAFVVGTFAFRGMLSATFDDIVATSISADVYVRGADAAPSSGSAPAQDATASASGMTQQRNPVPADLATAIARVDGVAHALPDYSGPVVLVGADGTAVTTQGPPSIAFGHDPDFPTAHLTAGHWPGPGEMALETGTVTASGLAVGDTTTVVLGDSPSTMTVSGTFAIDAAAAGAVLVVIDSDTAREAFAPDGQVQQIAVYADSGVSPDALAQRIDDALPASANAQAVTGDVVRDEATASIQDALGFLQTFLLIFAAIALVVGAFIITNAFAMAVRERQREHALLRAIGASPTQVFATVLAQALAVGVVGSGIGAGLGIALVHGIRAVLDRFGMPFAGRIPLTGGQFAAAIALGTVLCLVAAALPARKAALVPPVEAMRDDVAPERRVRARAVSGVLLAGAGVALLVLASRLGTVAGLGAGFGASPRVTGWAWLDTRSPTWVLGVGAGLLLVGVLTGSPAVARGVLRGLGAPAVWWLGTLGRLARGNVTRNPRRTAATAGALTIGMALVACTGIIAASARESVATIVDAEMRAPLVVDSPTFRIPADAVDAVRAVPGVGSTEVVRLASAAVATSESATPENSAPDDATPDAATSDDGHAQAATVIGVSTTFFTDALRVQALDGDPATALIGGKAAVGRTAARTLGVGVGDELTIGQGALARTVTVGAVFESQIVGTTLALPSAVFDAVVPPTQESVRAIYVLPAQGTDVATLQADLRDAVKPFLVVSVRDHAETTSAVAGQVDQAIAILYALLALSIVIALLGIVNTLALSVVERTREIGLLRAVGLGRLQLSAVIALESVLIAVYGTVLGVATGTAVAAALPGVLADQGLTRLAIPWGQVLLVLAAAVVIGLLASIGPAVRAARLPILDAVATAD